MKEENPFDRKILLQKGRPSFDQNAAIELTATLDLCWAAAQSVFGKKAAPEHALTLLPMFMQRADAKRQQALAQHAERMAAASAQPAPAKRRKPGPKEE
jgi:hypothetical protein